MIIRARDIHKQETIDRQIIAITAVAKTLGYTFDGHSSGFFRVVTGKEETQTPEELYQDREAFVQLCNEYKA